MSHFFTVVLVSKDTDGDLKSKVQELLEPYWEELEVPPYETQCYCTGREAHKAARDAANAQTGTIEELRKSFWEAHKLTQESTDEERDRVDQEWTKHIAEHRRIYEEALANHPKRDKPQQDPMCEECRGSGKLTTAYNPKSKWDWWGIGGRYDGMIFSDEEAEARRTDNGFNWGPEHEKAERNSSLVRDLPEDFHCFAIVTPDGEWHERGRMGWWGIVSDEKDKDHWLGELRRILAQYPDYLAVGCDLHI